MLDKLTKSHTFRFVFATVVLFGCTPEPVSNPRPEVDGYVNDANTAIKIAEAVWLPIFGDEIYDHTPFKAQLTDSVWIVTGTVHTKLGGAPRMVIGKRDGRILELFHEL